MSTRQVQPASGPVDAVVRLPGSKSLSNRALVSAALSRGKSVLSNFLFADDTRYLLDGLAALGIGLQISRDDCRVEVHGRGGHLPAGDAEIDCGESGTMLRFMAALCASAVGDYRLFGHGRLHERPMGPLIQALGALGTQVEFEEREDFAPLIIHGRGLTGGEVEVDGSLSSQFVSGLLLVSPCARRDVMLTVAGRAVSTPYVRMTCEVMAEFGVACVTEDFRKIIVPAPQSYQSTHFSIEPDASNASYILAIAAISGGRVRIEGLGRRSCQGDLGFVDILKEMGCEAIVDEEAVEVRFDPAAHQLRGREWDMGDMPDVAPTVAVLGLFAGQPTRICNVAHLRHKESDRLAALASQLKRLGAGVELHEDGLTVHPPSEIVRCVIDPFNDHRMAMALALVGLAVEGIAIADSECVSKSFPDYFSLLEKLVSRG